MNACVLFFGQTQTGSDHLFHQASETGSLACKHALDYDLKLKCTVASFM